MMDCDVAVMVSKKVDASVRHYSAVFARPFIKANPSRSPKKHVIVLEDASRDTATQQCILMLMQLQTTNGIYCESMHKQYTQ